MIIITFKILLTITIHLLLYVLYPDTGKYDMWYLWTSIVLWIVFWLWFSEKFSTLKKLLFPLSILINAGIFILMIFFITITMPQEDGTMVIKKISTGKFPSSENIERGKIKYFYSLGLNNSKIDLNKLKDPIKKSYNKIAGE